MAPSWIARHAARLAASTAVATVVVLTLMVIVAGALTPGYSHLSQYISELGARGAPQEWGVRLAGFLPAGVLLLAFCGFAHAALPRSAGATFGLVGLVLYAAGYLVAAVFPCDPGCRPVEPSASQRVHDAAGLIGYLVAPAFLLALARAARTWPGAGRLAVAGYAAAGLALIGLLALSPTSPTAGLGQRLLEFAVLAWVVCCGRYLARREGHGAGRPAPPGPRHPGASA